MFSLHFSPASTSLSRAVLRVLLFAAAMSVLLLLLALLLGRVNPSYSQLLYISQASSVTDDRSTLYIHDLRANLRLPVVKSYLGWGSDAAWSPDGRYIAFSQFQQGVVRRDIYVLDLYTRQQRLVSLGQEAVDYNSPSWSPDGTQLVYHGMNPLDGVLDLYVLDLETNLQSLLYSGLDNDVTPAWSPDGQWVVFESTDVPHFSPNIFMLALENMEMIRLTDTPNTHIYPAWSPDSEQIVFSALREYGDNYALYVLNRQTKRIRLLTRHPSRDYSEPAWSPRGDLIAYVDFTPSGSRIAMISARGGRAYPVTAENEAYRQPFWRP